MKKLLTAPAVVRIAGSAQAQAGTAVEEAGQATAETARHHDREAETVAQAAVS